MGKYMKKSKITSDVAVMEVSQSSTSGVRTRARTLAMQRLQSSSTDTTSYLQLRSRRLEKPPLLQVKETKKTQQPRENKNSPVSVANRDLLVSKGSSRLRVKAGGDCEKERGRETDGCFGENEEMLGSKCEAEDVEAEACFGENYLELEARGRSTRESTPCSLIRGSDTTGTPGSTTRPSSSTAANRRVTNNVHRKIPMAYEIEEFFARAEEEQHRLLMEKYNFDFVNDLPLPGRFEWVQVIP